MIVFEEGELLYFCKKMSAYMVRYKGKDKNATQVN